MSTRCTLPNRRAHELLDFNHDGIGYTVGVGRFDNGQIAEIFLDCEHRGSAAEAMARDAATVTSIALQFGADLGTIQHALTRLHDGSGAGPLGRALDLIATA